MSGTIAPPIRTEAVADRLPVAGAAPGSTASTVAAEASVRRFPICWLLLAMALVGGSPEPAGAHQAASAEPRMPLGDMTFEDAEKAGTVGTGCTWLGGPGRTRRLSMADDRAAVRYAGAIVVMRPASDAKALFLTHDRWVSGAMRIVVRDTGKVVRRGSEFNETVAWLDLVEGGRTRSFSGRLNCGS